MNSYQIEKEKQEQLPWTRSAYHRIYNEFLVNYEIKSCLENKHGTSLLEFACGDGFMTAQFQPHFETVIGVDASKTRIETARKRAPGVVFYESLIEEFHLDQKFDSVLMLHVLGDVIDPVLTLQKASNFLKENGVLIVHVPNADAINRKIAVLMGTLTSCDELSPFDVQVTGHRRLYTLQTLKQAIVKAGLSIKKTGGIFYKMLSTPQMDWLLEQGLWQEGGFGWGRVGAEKEKDWRAEFCRACYEIGKERPEDCNVIYACITR